MLSSRLMATVGDLVCNETFYKGVSTENEVLIRVNQLSWHHTKCIVIGRVIEAKKPHHLGLPYIGTTYSVYGVGLTDFDALVDSVSDADREYLLARWDIDNPTTSHEMSVAFKRQQGSDVSLPFSDE